MGSSKASPSDATAPSTSTSNYTMGHHPSVTASHASRTAASDAPHLLPHLKPHMRILDIGCGPGTITTGFLPYVSSGTGSVTGIDLGEGVVADARAKAAALDLPASDRAKLKFETGNVMTGLAFPDASFDVVFSSQLFPHLTDPLPALREMRRLLKPNGILATRDGAAMHWHPASPATDAFTRNLLFATGNGAGFPGAKMHGYMRAVGFDPARMVVGAGTTCIADPAGTRWWGECMAGRLERSADTEFRRSWVQAGIGEEEIEEVMTGLRAWGQEEDGWYCIVQSEILAWK